MCGVFVCELGFSPVDCGHKYITLIPYTTLYSVYSPVTSVSLQTRRSEGGSTKRWGTGGREGPRG